MIILKNIKLQAHKGVSSECPENTMAAFNCAVMQGYDVIELDLEYTKDKKIVVLHDKFINRTARNKDGTSIDREISINEITYEEALQYDFGVAVSNKYRGEKIPLFEDVLKMAEETMIHLKIDNKVQSFPEEILCILFSQIKCYTEYISITSNNVGFIKKCLKEVPSVAIDYDGEVTEDVLNILSVLVPKGKLTVWLPYRCEYTSWVKIPFADEKSAELVRKYAKLGIWLLRDYGSLYDVAERFKADIIETDGTIKPIKNINCRYDMHTHSKNSHDSECEVSALVDKAKKRGLSGFAVTDHCDIEYYETLDINSMTRDSLDDVVKINSETDLTVLRGIEIGEATWHKHIADQIIKKFDFDVVIGSVHAVKFDEYEMPYSCINFAKMGKETAEKYIGQYFEDVLKMIASCDFDILAHLTCPLRYINGKYEMGVDCKMYENKIKSILECIIERKIALEINTSCVYEGSKYCELMPEQWIIQMYKDMGGYLVTTGSDAHIAENLANNFDMLYDTLKQIGFKNAYYYKNRCAVEYEI